MCTWGMGLCECACVLTTYMSAYVSVYLCMCVVVDVCVWGPVHVCMIVYGYAFMFLSVHIC